MSAITFRSDSSVELIDFMGSDSQVVHAARISTGGDRLEPMPKTTEGLIKYLMANRHGTPFEHNAFTFRVECPIFVAREFMRHRIASYNEESARYKQLDAVFWVPDAARGLVQTGKPGHYVIEPGTPEQFLVVQSDLRYAARICYEAYQSMLENGVAREVARACLPVGIYTSFYVTMNARGLMNFLSLRVGDPHAAFPSKPQYEIDQAAQQMEKIFAYHMPVTARMFALLGRVAP
jgi:thymidylate synthase (FAD)